MAEYQNVFWADPTLKFVPGKVGGIAASGEAATKRDKVRGGLCQATARSRREEYIDRATVGWGDAGVDNGRS